MVRYDEKYYNADAVRTFFRYADSAVSGGLLVFEFPVWHRWMDLYSRILFRHGRICHGGIQALPDRSEKGEEGEEKTEDIF